MALERGPFILQPDSAILVQPGVYDFQDSVIQWWADVDAVTLEMDALIPDLEAFALEPSDPLPDINLDGLLAIGVTAATYDLVPEYDDMLAAVGDATTQLGVALNDAPPQAFTAPSGAFTPNIDGLVLAPPVVPPGAFNPAGITPVGTTNPAGGAGAAQGNRTVALINNTQVGAANFTVGDQFKLTATGNPGDEVSVTGTFNGQDFAPVVFGTIDQTGKFSLTGVEGPDNIGVWREDWSVGGQFITTYNFIVSPNSQT